MYLQPFVFYKSCLQNDINTCNSQQCYESYLLNLYTPIMGQLRNKHVMIVIWFDIECIYVFAQLYSYCREIELVSYSR